MPLKIEITTHFLFSCFLMIPDLCTVSFFKNLEMWRPNGISEKENHSFECQKMQLSCREKKLWIDHTHKGTL